MIAQLACPIGVGSKSMPESDRGRHEISDQLPPREPEERDVNKKQSRVVSST